MILPQLGPWLEVSEREGGRSHDLNHGTVNAEWFRADRLQIHLEGGESPQATALRHQNAGRGLQPNHYHYNHECLRSEVSFLSLQIVSFRVIQRFFDEIKNSKNTWVHAKLAHYLYLILEYYPYE